MVQLVEKKVVLKIKLENGQNESGKVKYKNISFKDINPEITDSHLDELGKKLSSLQSLPLVEVFKLQTEKVVEA